MARLRHDGATLDLPALEPPEELAYAYDACQEMQRLIAAGEVAYTLDGVRRWLSGGASARECRLRERKLAAIKRLLKGGRLAEADARFAEAYRAYLASHPRRQAAWLLAKQALRAGGEIDGLAPCLIEALRAA